MTLASRIRESRYAKGWGPDELASRANISRTALYQIECGKTETPRAATLRRIAVALGVSIDMLLGHPAWDVVAVEPMHETPPTDSRRFADRGSSPISARASEVERKFQELLASPLGEGVARIVEESHRMLASPRSG